MNIEEFRNINNFEIEELKKHQSLEEDIQQWKDGGCSTGLNTYWDEEIEPLKDEIKEIKRRLNIIENFLIQYTKNG